MSTKKDLMKSAVLMGLIAVAAAGCASKKEPQMIDVASRLEQARAERAAMAAQQPVQVVDPAVQTVQPARKYSYVK